MAEVYRPILRWAQTKEKLFLTLELSDIQFPVVELTDNRLHFQGYGHGARGQNNYELDVTFREPIDPKASNHKILDRYVEFTIAKKEDKQEFWPRLLMDEKKPAWLKVNFDRWKSEDSDSAEGEEQDPGARIQNIVYENRMRERQLEDEIERTKQEVIKFTKKFYLVTYNLLQAGLFLYIVLKIIWNLSAHGKDAIPGIYDSVSDVLATCQVAAFLEIINPAVGLVKTGLLAPVMQVLGRNLVLFFVIVSHKELHSSPWVTGLFLAWSLVEIIRYPFYAAQTLGICLEPLVWLRYSAWIPLYPVGVICEGALILKAIPLLDRSGRFSYTLPNALNFSFSLAGFLRFYIIILALGGIYMMKHMLILRQKRYGKKKKAN